MQSNKAQERNLKINNIRQTLRAVPIMRKATLQVETKLKKILKKSSSFYEALFDKDLADSASQSSQEDQSDSLFNDHYTLGEKIGQGAHGVVRKCYSKQTGSLFAVKTFKVDRQHIIFLKHNFIDIKKLHHQNIIAYKALFFDMQSQKCHLVMDYLPFPDLMQIPIKTEQKLKELTLQLIQTLFYVHLNKICHRDVKPENILYDQVNNRIILIDFGISRKLTKRGIKRDMLTLTGTPYYRAPQMFQGGGYDELVDIWALGVTIYKLMTGSTPFESEYHSETIGNIMRGQFIFPPDVEARYSRQARFFISRLLKRRSERVTARQALNDLWFIDLEKKVDEYTRSMTINEKLQKNQLNVSTNVVLLHRTHTNAEQQLLKLGQTSKSREETIKSLKCLDEYTEEQDSKIYGCPDDEFGLD